MNDDLFVWFLRVCGLDYSNKVQLAYYQNYTITRIKKDMEKKGRKELKSVEGLELSNTGKKTKVIGRL